MKVYENDADFPNMEEERRMDIHANMFAAGKEEYRPMDIGIGEIKFIEYEYYRVDGVGMYCVSPSLTDARMSAIAYWNKQILSAQTQISQLIELIKADDPERAAKLFVPIVINKEPIAGNDAGYFKEQEEDRLLDYEDR